MDDEGKKPDVDSPLVAVNDTTPATPDESAAIDELTAPPTSPVRSRGGWLAGIGGIGLALASIVGFHHSSESTPPVPVAANSGEAPSDSPTISSFATMVPQPPVSTVTESNNTAVINRDDLKTAETVMTSKATTPVPTRTPTVEPTEGPEGARVQARKTATAEAGVTGTMAANETATARQVTMDAQPTSTLSATPPTKSIDGD